MRFRHGLLAATLALAGTTAVEARTVVMISVDGMNPEYVTQAEARGLKMPNLRRFMTEGSYADGVTGVVPTVSWPSAVALMTGTPPTVSGVLNNEHFEPSDRNKAPGIYLYASDVKTDTLWDAATRAGLVTANVDQLASVGSASVRYDVPRFEVSPWAAENRKALEAVSRPPNFLQKMEADLGPYDGLDFGKPGYDASRAKFAIATLRRYKPQFLSIHFSGVDVEAHGHGPFSSEAKQAAENIDGLIGDVWAAARAGDPDTVIVVVSDHGQVPLATQVNLRIPLVEAGLISIDGPAPGRTIRVTDWKADVWNGGDTAIMLRDPSDAVSRAKVSGLLHKLATDPAYGIAHVYEGDELARLQRRGWTGAAFLVSFRTGYFGGGALTGDTLARLPEVRGGHGFLPENPGVNASFFIAGKGVQAGRDLGQIDMLRIAPTVAHALGVTLRDAKEPVLPVFIGR